MAVAHDPSDEQEFVSKDMYYQSIGVMAHTASQYRDERDAMQAERDDARADANTALVMLTEARGLLRRCLPLLNAAPGFKDEIRALLADGTPGGDGVE